MLLRIANVLSAEEVASVRERLDELAFVDGRATAGWAARAVKRNRQAAPGPEFDALNAEVTGKIVKHPVISLAARPKTVTQLLFARYGVGNEYGTHVDDALMLGMRTDLSFTLFLAEPDTYEGGALVIESTSGEEDVKLPAGHLVLYPSGALHRVEAVTRGERVAAVGWIRSFVRSTEQRELLFDLDTARRSLHGREGATMEFQLLSKSLTNLLRMWAED
jgi:PKHD-type hydroxylase